MSQIVLDPADDNGKSDPTVWVEKIAFLNASTLVSDSDVDWWATLCAKQLRQDFCPLWGIPAPEVYYAPDESKVDPKAQLVVFLDKSDAPGAAAYHDFTPLGNPYAKVFPSEGTPLVSVSHECAELTLDPMCNSWVLNPATGIFQALEAADAVEADTYKLDGEQVSSFLLPGFWALPARLETDRAGAMLLSFTGTAPAAWTTASGGYQIYKDPRTGEISQAFGPDRSVRRAAGKQHPAARTAARLAGKKRVLRGMQVST